MERSLVSVGSLVSMMQTGELRLPAMQRRFVWQSTRGRDLLDSLYRGYPSGNTLRKAIVDAINTFLNEKQNSR
jgi:uncharacterized protein with ParB-like and HNH nuclease domain